MGLQAFIEKYGSGELDKRNWFSMGEPKRYRTINTSVEQLSSNGDSCITLPEEQKDT